MYYMKVTKTPEELEERFKAYGREDNFTSEAIKTLHMYLKELSVKEDYKSDIIALCLDWAEYDAEWLLNDYGYFLEEEDFTPSDEDLEEEELEEEMIKELIKILQKKTVVLPVTEKSWLIATF